MILEKPTNIFLVLVVALLSMKLHFEIMIFAYINEIVVFVALLLRKSH